MPRKTTGRETNKQKREQSKKKQNKGGIEKTKREGSHGKNDTEMQKKKEKRDGALCVFLRSGKMTTFWLMSKHWS